MGRQGKQNKHESEHVCAECRQPESAHDGREGHRFAALHIPAKRERINAASKTRRLIVLVESETEDRVNDARGKTSMSAWIRDAIEAKLMLFPNTDFRFSEVRRIVENANIRESAGKSGPGKSWELT